MIVTRLRLHPFGCFADREVRFGPTLNVVLGPNEAGKSTLFHAARSTLLRARLKSQDFARHIGRFVPAGGGDTVRVDVDFLADEGAYSLRRSWGSSPSSELVLPGGELLTDDEAVKARLERLLPARQAAFWGVLFTGQGELTQAVESLRKEAGSALADLTDILRRSVLETGGVSPDRFRAELERRIARSFDSWDIERDCPKSNRGIDNPWKKSVGIILESFYDRERIERELRRARELERELDSSNSRLREVTEALAAGRRFLEDGKRAYDDARERRVLEANLAVARSRQDELARLVREWPVAESRREELVARVAKLRALLDPLGRERKEAELAESGARLREKLARIERIQAEAERLRAETADSPAISRAEVEAIRAAELELSAARAGLEASSVVLTLEARSRLSVEVRRDSGPAEPVSLDAGARRELAAERLIRVRHGDLELEARSGDADRGDRRKALGESDSRLASLLARHGVSGAQEADERERARAALSQAAAAAERDLHAELAGESLEELRRRAAPRVDGRPARATAAVAAEIATVEAEIRERSRDLEELERRIREWEAVHASLPGLIDALAAERGRSKEIEGQIASGAPLPTGFTAATEFVTSYEAALRERERLAERRADLRTRKAALEARLPDQSAEELEGQLEQASERFATVVGQGRALLRIRDVTRRLLSASDREVFAGMREELGRLISATTAGRYREVELAGSLPRGLVPRDGAALGWERLSAGTRDLLALALRLVMASRFLGSSRGFVMMDDPLVEMDPTRQAAAASAMRAFATDRQLVVFTCHPAHAELLGGERIEL